MKYQFIDKYRSVYRVEKMCRSSYYTWKERSKSMRDIENERLVFNIKRVHEKNRKTFGYI